ncbi:hypothetical protein BUALT_Bualt03G0167800 [Buddleja alternifolia]|uniref:Uncharacterized protein n=1 Tax=Buddleja alternifolia TaxID=168488 RepID=A0AAV6XVD1_9LAMI|nr:hypothetical protein BUALT_Bualt03G0167800 [Buddleja alternifolia]
MDFSIFRSPKGKRDSEEIAVNNIKGEADRGTYSRESDGEQNGTRKQSAFLHESFKNPKPSTRGCMCGRNMGSGEFL